MTVVAHQLRWPCEDSLRGRIRQMPRSSQILLRSPSHHEEAAYSVASDVPPAHFSLSILSLVCTEIMDSTYVQFDRVDRRPDTWAVSRFDVTRPSFFSDVYGLSHLKPVPGDLSVFHSSRKNPHSPSTLSDNDLEHIHQQVTSHI